MRLRTDLASIIFQIEKNESELFSKFWSWKLDPFRISEEVLSESFSCDVLFHNSGDTVANKLQTETLLFQERSGFFLRSVYRLSSGCILWQLTEETTGDIYLSFLVNQDWNNIQLLIDKTNSGGSAAFEYLAQITPGIFLRHHLLTLHSSLVEYHDYAFSLCADSGIGKTTRARLWRDLKNALILNGDRTVCGKKVNEWRAYGTPWSGTSGEQLQRSAPLKAIVILKRADNKKNTIIRLTPQDAFPLLLPHLLYPNWDYQMSDLALTELNQLLNELPVFLLYSNPDAEGIDLLENALEALH